MFNLTEHELRGGFCWRCHKPLPLKEQHSCPSCVRVFHERCWWNVSPYSSKDVLVTHHFHLALEHCSADSSEKIASTSVPPECVECFCFMAEAKKLDNIAAKVGMDKFKSYLLHIMRFVHENLPQDRVRPFSTPVLEQDQCSEAIKTNYADLITFPMDLRQIHNNISQGKYTTIYSFLSDLRWIYHNSSIFNGQNNYYTHSAFHIVETCQHLCYSLEWCRECFERGMPVGSESIQQAVERGMVTPCSDPHAVVWVKAEKYPLWPAIVYRYHGSTAEVRFFGAFEFGVFHEDAVFLFSKSAGTDRSKGGINLDYKNALRQFRQHVSKLRLIPDKQLHSYPKRTKYDGRLRMFPEGEINPNAPVSDSVPTEAEDILLDSTLTDTKAASASGDGNQSNGLDTSIEILAEARHEEERSENRSQSLSRSREDLSVVKRLKTAVGVPVGEDDRRQRAEDLDTEDSATGKLHIVESDPLSHSSEYSDAVAENVPSFPIEGNDCSHLIADPQSIRNRRNGRTLACCVRTVGVLAPSPLSITTDDAVTSAVIDDNVPNSLSSVVKSQLDCDISASLVDADLFYPDTGAAGMDIGLEGDGGQHMECDVSMEEATEVTGTVKPIQFEDTDSVIGEMPSFEMPEDALDIRTRTAGKLHLMLKRKS